MRVLRTSPQSVLNNKYSRLIDERYVARTHQIILNQPSDKLSSHRHRELVQHAKSRGHDEDEIVKENDAEVSQPLDFAVVSKQVEIGDAWKVELGLIWVLTSLIPFLPNIRDSSGKADVKIRINELLAIKWLREVFLRFGRMFAKIGMA